MTELITLNLTLEELQQIDKCVEVNDDTLSVLMKIKDAYPLQKSPVEEAYKRLYYGYPPTSPSVSNFEDERWSAFQNGYDAAFLEGCKVKEKEQKWDVVREGVKWCEESVEDYLKPHTPEKTEQLLREAFQKVQQTEEWKETQRKIDELVESETSPPEPTSTVFRQKLFDGIKSVFYDPEYERTNWKMKVDMAVDEVLTHFYDIIPEPQEPICDEFVKGWNCCLAEIKTCMEFTDG